MSYASLVFVSVKSRFGRIKPPPKWLVANFQQPSNSNQKNLLGNSDDLVKFC